MSNVNLSPPWYTFANEIAYSYGESPFIHVQPLVAQGTGYLLVINVSNDNVAQSLRNVLPLTQDFGGVIVEIVIYNSFGIVVSVSNQAYTPKTLAQTFCTALMDNPLFAGVVLVPIGSPPSLGNIAIVIEKEVIQFYNDNISDLCSNFNEVAAQVFADVTVQHYPPNLSISFSTFDPHCILQKDFYCSNACPPRPCPPPPCPPTPPTPCPPRPCPPPPCPPTPPTPCPPRTCPNKPAYNLPTSRYFLPKCPKPPYC